MNDFFGFLVCIAATWFLTWLFVEPRIYPESVGFASEVCATNEGWSYIQEGHSEGASVKCKNGAEFEFKWADIGKKK